MLNTSDEDNDGYSYCDLTARNKMMDCSGWECIAGFLVFLMLMVTSLAWFGLFYYLQDTLIFDFNFRTVVAIETLAVLTSLCCVFSCHYLNPVCGQTGGGGRYAVVAVAV